MNTFSHVPPGFRFHPTDEELVDYYLKKKVASKRIDLDVIKDVDLYKIEPWDLQELCKLGSDEQSEWYFFSHKDKKYPTGTRTNRATKAGFWKATGRDKSIYSKHSLIGMRKTLVFYKGRAPNGQKSDWIMHEYRLETNENGTPQEEGWVVCKVFKKRMTTTVRKMGEYGSPCWYDEQVSFMQEQDSHSALYAASHHHHQYPCKQELELMQQYNMHRDANNFLQLPQLESPKLPHHHHQQSYNNNNNGSALQTSSLSTTNQEEHIQQCQQQSMQLMMYGNNNNNSSNNDQATEQVMDWRVLDKFVASQLSHDDQDDHVSKETSYSNVAEQIALLANGSNNKPEEIIGQEYAAASTSSTSICQIDLWK